VSTQARQAWNPWVRPSIVHLSLGADRYVDKPEPMPERRHPLGFTMPPTVREPLLWEGDDA
jgi:hypothetical protein